MLYMAVLAWKLGAGVWQYRMQGSFLVYMTSIP